MDRVKQLKEEFDLDVVWKMIEIHPETPTQGIPIELIKRGFMNNVWINVKKIAEDSNIDIKIPPILSNSKLATIASEYAKTRGKFDDYHNAVFEAYWKNEKDIGDINVLIKIAEEINLDSEGLKEYIGKENWKQTLENNLNESYDNFVTGVPTFIINEKIIPGAAPYSSIRKVYQKEKAALKKLLN
jgi:predicted DsbA family dithiol-disulfide isomerase